MGLRKLLDRYAGGLEVVKVPDLAEAQAGVEGRDLRLRVEAGGDHEDEVDFEAVFDAWRSAAETRGHEILRLSLDALPPTYWDVLAEGLPVSVYESGPLRADFDREERDLKLRYRTANDEIIHDESVRYRMMPSRLDSESALFWFKAKGKMPLERYVDVPVLETAYNTVGGDLYFFRPTDTILTRETKVYKKGEIQTVETVIGDAGLRQKVDNGDDRGSSTREFVIDLFESEGYLLLLRESREHDDEFWINEAEYQTTDEGDEIGLIWGEVRSEVSEPEVGFEAAKAMLALPRMFEVNRMTDNFLRNRDLFTGLEKAGYEEELV